MGKIPKVVAIFIIVFASVLLFFRNGNAQPDIVVIMTPEIPSSQTYPCGSAPIAFTAVGKKAVPQYEWILLGPGTLEHDRHVAIYTPPKKENCTTGLAVINVKVHDEQNREATATFSVEIVSPILSIPATSVPPKPTPLPASDSSKIGKSKMWAVGLGTAAAVGLGATLLLSDKDDSSTQLVTCDGLLVEDYCWYLGAQGQSCDVVCASHGGYDEATRTYAGSEGSNSNCYTVLAAVGAPVGYSDNVTTESNWAGLGCCYWYYNERARWTRDDLSPTNSRASYPTIHRICACKN